MTAMSVATPPTTETTDLAQLVATHQAHVWRYVRYLGADSAEADDLVQETFLAVMRSDFRQQGDRQTAQYLRTTARNQLLMHRRKQNRGLSLVELEAAEQVWADTFQSTTANQFLDTLADCVAKLEGRAKQAIQLHYHDGASRNAIAEKLSMKPAGVKTLLRRTRNLLRQCLNRDAHERSA